MGVRMYVFPVQLPARGFVYALLTCMYVYIHIFGERERELEREREAILAQVDLPLPFGGRSRAAR